MAEDSPNSTSQQQHMQPPSHNTLQRAESCSPDYKTIITAAHKTDITGKSPYPYQMSAGTKTIDRIIQIVAFIDRKHYIIPIPQTNKSKHLSLQSPHTRVCGKRWVYDKITNTLSMKTKSKIHITSCLSIGIDVLTKICNDHVWPKDSHGTPKLTHPTNTISYMKKMTGQGSGKEAARDLTEDPDFAMLEANSPPQGQKRLGGGKTSSGEKRKASSSEKRSKPTSKDKTPPIQHFWLGFDTMEKLALE